MRQGMGRPKHTAGWHRRLLAGAAIGVALAGLGQQADRWSLKTGGALVALVALAGLSPEGVLLAVLGGSKERVAAILGPLGVPSTGFIFAAMALATVGGARAILRARGMWSRACSEHRLSLGLVAVLSGWMAVDVVVGHTAGPVGVILSYYLIHGCGTCLLWYVVLTRLEELPKRGVRLLWWVCLTGVAGLLAGMLRTEGSLRPLIDPSAAYWAQGGEQLETATLSHISFSVDLIAPAGICALALGVSSVVPIPLRIGLFGVVGAAAALVGAAGTRQALLGGVAAVATMAFIAFGSHRSFRMGMVGALGVLAVAAPVAVELQQRFGGLGTERITRLSDSSDRSFLGRLDSLEQDWRGFLDRPLTGAGLGAGAGENASGRIVSHNILSSVALEMGIAPTLLLAAWVLRVAIALVKLPAARLSESSLVAATGLGGLFALWLVSSLISGRLEGGFPFFGPGLGLILLAQRSEARYPFADRVVRSGT